MRNAQWHHIQKPSRYIYQISAFLGVNIKGANLIYLHVNIYRIKRLITLTVTITVIVRVEVERGSFLGMKRATCFVVGEL